MRISPSPSCRPRAPGLTKSRETTANSAAGRLDAALSATSSTPSTFIAVLPALVLTGASSARIGGSSPRLGRDQVVLGGAAGLAITYLVGDLFGVGV